ISQHPLEQAIGPAIGALRDDDVISRPEQPQRGVDRRHPRSKAVSGKGAFERGEISLQRGAGRVLRPGVFKPLVSAQSLLDVRRSLVNRCYYCAGCGVRLLSRVYRLCRKSHKQRMRITCRESATDIKDSAKKKKADCLETFRRRHILALRPAGSAPAPQ